MKRRLSYLLLFLLLLALVLGYVFRYQQLAYTPTVQRYLDRWTGIDWVKTYSWEGLIRLPAHFYEADIAYITQAEKQAELIRIQKSERLITISWYILVILLSAVLVKNLTRNVR